MFFLNWLVCVRQVSAATASSYLAGMRKIHILRGVEEPKLRQSLVNQVLKGKKNMEAIDKRGKDNKGRLPVTLTLMKIIKAALRVSGLPGERVLLVWTVCTLAFHGSFRIHEILARNETFYDPDFCLLGQDIVLRHAADKPGSKAVLLVNLKCPKENRNGTVTVVDVYETTGETCPVKAFLKWSSRHKIDKEKVCFTDEWGVPLTGRRFNSILKSLLQPHIDYRIGQITSHSFRSGIPSLLASLGHDDDDIKTVGRWSSRAFEAYTKLPKTSRAAMALRLGKI